MQFRPSSSRTEIKVYTERIKPSKNISGASYEERAIKTLDVLYIHDMQNDDGNSEKSASEVIKRSKANYGEINLSKLRGNSAEEKMSYLEEALSKLREEGKLTNSTDVIFACKPAANGKFEIENGSSKKQISIDRVIKTVRGVADTRHASGLSAFEGTIHLFGFDQTDFSDLAKRASAGNVLLHANGKFNWDYKHENIVGKIIESSGNIRASQIDLNPEQRTRKMRDVLQMYLGHPILRLSGNKIKIKYPRDDKGVWSKPQRDAVKRHRNPVDMLISCIERGAVEKTRIHLARSGLGEKIQAAIKDGSLGADAKTRLLIAVVCSKNEQKKKLDLLREYGIKFNDRDLKHVKILQSAIFKNRDAIEPEVIAFLENTLKLETVSKKSLANFLCRKITHCMTEGFWIILTAVRERLSSIPRDQIFDLVEAVLSSDSTPDLLRQLVDAGLRIQDLNNDEKEMVADLIGEIKDPSKAFLFIDFFEKNKVRLEHITGDFRAMCEIFSKDRNKQNNGQRQLEKWINDALTQGGDAAGKVETVIRAAIKDAYLQPPDFSILKILLDAGWDPSWMIPFENHNLFHLICSHTENLKIDFLDFLVKNSKSIGNINAASGENNEGMSPLHYLAMMPGNQEVTLQAAELLINAGANVNIVNRSGNAPIHFAAERHNTKMLELLLRNKADVDKQNNIGYTPLIAAVASAAITQSSRLDKGSFNTAVRTLLSNHADLLLTDRLGATAQDFFELIPGYENADLETIQKILLGYAVA